MRRQGCLFGVQGLSTAKFVADGWCFVVVVVSSRSGMRKVADFGGSDGGVCRGLSDWSMEQVRCVDSLIIGGRGQS